VLLPTYARRQRTMLQAIKEYLVPLGVKLPQSERRTAGGYFIWIALPQTLDAVEVANRARDQENLIVASGSLFEVPGDPTAHKFSHEIRLCFAWEDEDKFTEGIQRLSVVMRDLLAKPKDGAISDSSYVDPAARNIPEHHR
jgi:DNA-binding transcriptional MocR family regulator